MTSGKLVGVLFYCFTVLQRCIWCKLHLVLSAIKVMIIQNYVKESDSLKSP
jgi:hypothetical protein